MAQQVINIGASPNDGGGDVGRDVFGKINANFAEIYGQILGYDSHASAPLQAVYINADGDVGIGTLAPVATLEVQDLNGNLYGLYLDIDDFDGSTTNQYGAYIGVDIADFVPTGNVVHHGQRTVVTSNATSTTQSSGQREYLYGSRIDVNYLGEQYFGVGQYVRSKHNSSDNLTYNYGQYILAYASAASGASTVSNLRGVSATARVDGAAANVNIAMGGYFETVAANAGASIATGYGVYALVDKSAGAFGVGYQIYGKTTGQPAVSWGFYSTGADKSFIEGISATETPLRVHADDPAFTGDVMKLTADIAAGTGFDFITATADYDGSTDVVFRVRGDGQVTCDGAFTGGGADYAEYFEWDDGNPLAEDRTGWPVVLVPGTRQIRHAVAGDEPFGAVSAHAVVVGDAAELYWQGKYVRDEWGRPIKEQFQVLRWNVDVIEQREVEQADGTISAVDVTRQKTVSYPSDRLPTGVVAPPRAETIAMDGDGKPFVRDKLSAKYNADYPYKPRADRQEWDAIGLTGKLRIRAGEVVAPGWLLMGEAADGINLWLVK